MSMTSQQVLEMAQKLNETEEEVNPVTESEVEVKPEIEETNATIPENQNVGEETPAQETEVDSKENKLSKEDKEKFAFAKLKNKEKQKREKLIADYESRIDALNAELEKHRDLKSENFETQDQYIQFMVDQRLKQMELSNSKMAKAQAEADNFEEINQQRISACFPDEKDRESYNRLIENSAPQFVDLLAQADPDNAVLSYLDDSEIAPLLIRILMTKPEVRNEVLSKKHPYHKMIAMDNLAKKVSYAKNILDKRNNTQVHETKPRLPVIGSVTKSDASEAKIDKNDPNYFNNMLHELNSRKR